MKQDVEQYMAILKQNCEAQEEYIQDLRGIKHDIDAHMIVLQYYLEEGCYDRAKAYLKQMQTHQEKMKRVYVEIGNRMLNAVLTERLKQSKMDIDVRCYGELPRELGCSEYDLCTIFSNLFSNAIEACEKLEEDKRRIDIEISYTNQLCNIVMGNPIDGIVDKEMLGVGTSKEDKNAHGHGVRNVKAAVARNAGTIEFRIEEGYFEVHVILPV